MPRRAAADRSERPRPIAAILSAADWRQRGSAGRCARLHGPTLVFLLVVGLGPILWMLKSSITPTQDTLR